MGRSEEPVLFELLRKQVASRDQVVEAAMAVPDEAWMRVIPRFYDDVAEVLSKGVVPPLLVVPDLWHPAMKVKPQHRESLLDLWHVAHDIGKQAGYQQLSMAKSFFGGSVYASNECSLQCVVLKLSAFFS